MKILPLIFAWMMTGCTSDDYVERTTSTSNGTITVTEIPVAKPEDVLFDKRCEKVLERRFE